MFTALTLSVALGAPVPPPAAPVAAGTAPRVMELKPNADGKVVVTVIRHETQKIRIGRAVAGGPAGGAAPAVEEREVQVPRTMTVELGEVKDLAVTTADGKKLEKEEALKKLEKGGIVVVSGDGNPVSPAYLKVFKDDTLVLAAKELAGPQSPTGVTRPALRPLPAPPVPAGPGGVQILPVQPGVIQVVPAQGGANGVVQVQVAPAAPAKPEKKEK